MIVSGGMEMVKDTGYLPLIQWLTSGKPLGKALQGLAEDATAASLKNSATKDNRLLHKGAVSDGQ